MKKPLLGFNMGFKAKAKKYKKESGEEEKKTSSKSSEGTEPCCINGCDNWSDKSMGGRSLSIENAEESWGQNYTVRKGRVRVCKSCYKKWKKDSKEDNHY